MILKYSQKIILSLGFRRSDHATLMRLSAPSVDSKTGITLGGSSVAPDGTWQPKPAEPVTASEDEFLIDLPAASAALLVIGHENPPATLETTNR